MSVDRPRSRFQDPEGPVWLDGNLVEPAAACIQVTDPAVQFGLGVFETVAVRQGRPLERAAHLDRLFACAARLDVPLPSRDELESAVGGAVARIPSGCGWLRLIASRSGRCAVFAGSMDPAEEGRSVSAVLLPWRKSPGDALAGLKSLNYAANVIGLEEAQRRGADEGIWLNTRGHVTEGCSSNLFVVKGRGLFTPAVRDGILPGIVRGIAIAAARYLGLSIHEGKLRLPRLLRADEAFLTSSTRGVRPLVQFEGKKVGRGRPGPITLAISEEVRKRRGLAVAAAVIPGT